MAADAAEHVLPRAQAIDVGRGGLLMAFVEPLGFLPGHRMLVSLRVGAFRLNALATVVRCERGGDFRTYAALSFGDLYEPDYDELCGWLDQVERETVDASF